MLSCVGRQRQRTGSVLLAGWDEFLDPHIRPALASVFEAADPLGLLALLRGQVAAKFPAAVLLHRGLLALHLLLYYFSYMKSTKVIRKKIGRPRIGKKPAVIVPMRLPEEIIKAVDAYARSEAIKSRAEAFRRLVEEALAPRGLAGELAKPQRAAKKEKT